MKKKISTIGILAALLLLLAAPAYAASIQVETDPASITAVGNINLKFTVMNDSSFTMRDMRIRGYNISETDNTLGGRALYPGEGITFHTQNVPVTQANLGTSVVYTFSWTEDGASKSQEIAVKFGEVGAAPSGADMTGSVAPGKSSGKQGDKITLTYTLKNPGGVSMTDVTIKDTIAPDAVIKSGATIEAGGTLTATYEHTLGSQDAVSEATVTYKLNGESKTLKLEKQTIAVASIKLSVNVTMGDPTPEGVLFTIVLKNDGNQTLSGISVKDDQGAAVNAEALTLQAGQETLLTHTVRAEETRVVSFTITGKDAADQPYEDKTGSYTVMPYVDPSAISFQLFTHVLEDLDENGRMKIRFTIQNNSTVQLSDATIAEAVLGVVVQPIPTLGQGETVNEMELIVGEPRELEFVATAKDPSGVEHTYSSSVKANLAVQETPTPVPETTPGEENTNRTGMSGTLVTVLIVLAVLMAVAGIALLVLSIYERKRNAEMDALDAEEYVRNTRVAPPAPEPQAPAKVKRREKKQKKNADPFEDEDDDDDFFEDTKPQNAVKRNTVVSPTPKAPEPQRAQQAPPAQEHGRQPKAQQTRQPRPAEQQGGGFRPAPIQPPPEPRPAIRPEPISRVDPQPPQPPVQAGPAMEPAPQGSVPQFAESPQYPPMVLTQPPLQGQPPQPQAPVESAAMPPVQQAPLRTEPVEPPTLPVSNPASPAPIQPQARPAVPAVETPPMQQAPQAPQPEQQSPIPATPPRTQAAGGVRNRIHRVRPVDQQDKE